MSGITVTAVQQVRVAAAAVHLIRRLSVIIPVLNEAAGLKPSLEALQWLRAEGHELIVVDGGSSDATVDIASPLVDVIIQSAVGRALQMNRGAEVASGDVFLFLHADTQLPRRAPVAIESALDSGHRWGRFNVRLSGNHFMFRIIERMINWRSCITGIATGDQAIFMLKENFQQADKFPDIALMEDIEMSRRLKRSHGMSLLRERRLSHLRHARLTCSQNSFRLRELKHIG